MAPGQGDGRSTPKRIRRSLSEWFEGERVPHPGDPAEALTYDALLSLRGWGEAEFRHARPELLHAARFALYAERMMPMLIEAERTQAMPLAGLRPDEKLAVARAKTDAAHNIGVIRPLLYPEDDDGQ